MCVWGWGQWVIHGRVEEGAERGAQDGWRETVKVFGGCCRWFEVVTVPLIVTSQGMFKLSPHLTFALGGATPRNCSVIETPKSNQEYRVKN